MTAVTELLSPMQRESSIDTQHDDAVHPEEMDPQLVRTLELVITFPKDSFSVNAMGHLTSDKKEIKYTVWYNSDQIFCQNTDLSSSFPRLRIGPFFKIRTPELDATSKKLNYSLRLFKASVTPSYRKQGENELIQHYENVIKISEIKNNIKDDSPLVIIHADNCLICEKEELSYSGLGSQIQHIKKKRKLTEPNFKLESFVKEIFKLSSSATILILSNTPDLATRLESSGVNYPCELVHFMRPDKPCSITKQLKTFLKHTRVKIGSFHTISHDAKCLQDCVQMFSATKNPCYMYHYIRFIYESCNEHAQHLLTKGKLNIKGVDIFNEQKLLKAFCEVEPSYVPILARQRVLLHETKTNTGYCPSLQTIELNTDKADVETNEQVTDEKSSKPDTKIEKELTDYDKYRMHANLQTIDSVEDPDTQIMSWSYVNTQFQLDVDFQLKKDIVHRFHVDIAPQLTTMSYPPLGKDGKPHLTHETLLNQTQIKHPTPKSSLPEKLHVMTSAQSFLQFSQGPALKLRAERQAESLLKTKLDSSLTKERHESLTQFEFDDVFDEIENDPQTNQSDSPITEVITPLPFPIKTNYSEMDPYLPPTPYATYATHAQPEQEKHLKNKNKEIELKHFAQSIQSQITEL